MRASEQARGKGKGKGKREREGERIRGREREREREREHVCGMLTHSLVSYKGTNPILRVPSSWPFLNYFPKVLSPNTNILGFSI